MKLGFRGTLGLGALVCVMSLGASAESITIAVASNFAKPLQALVDRFEADSGHRASISRGSTGKHFAQIINGAPFDVFLAADADRPRKLSASGKALAHTQFTYAIGRLVVLRAGDLKAIQTLAELADSSIRRIAIANPRLAPYGAAAREVLIKEGLWHHLNDRLVRGENIAQTYQFVHSGNADLGFVARSQIADRQAPGRSRFWLVPANLHSPIVQDAVLLRESTAGRAFMTFLGGPVARHMIRLAGYDLAAQ